MCQHGSCCCFAVCTGNANGIRIVFHDLSNHFGTLHHRKSHFFGGAKFGIVRMNSGGVYDKVNVGSDVIAFLTIQYFHP